MHGAALDRSVRGTTSVEEASVEAVAPLEAEHQTGP